MMTYSFTEAEGQRANEEWGANCGPCSLAFILQVPLEAVRGKIPGFEQKKYTSPTMMKQGLAAMGRTVTEYAKGKPTGATMFGRNPSLVRVQWTGPWTAAAANPKWAYRYTHWIVCWRSFPSLVLTDIHAVFDCNGGIRTFESWRDEIVPLLTDFPRSDRGWMPTHVWRLD